MVTGVVAKAGGPAALSVEIEPPQSCGSCHGSCLMWRPASRRTFPLAPKCPPGLQIGDRVDVSLPASVLLATAALTHGLPWLGLLVGAGVGQWFFASDLGCLAGAVAGVVLAWRLGRGLEARLERTVAARLRVRAS